MRRPWLAATLSGSIGVGLYLALGCGDALVASPFASPSRVSDADAGAGEPDSGISGPNEGQDDPRPEFIFGAPCVDDAQCDDGIDCTVGVCDPELRVCRFSADDTRCDDGIFCNGSERCEL